MAVDGKVLLEGLSLDAVAGTLMAVVGPSGCGKSTLVKALIGIQPSSGGSVTLGGIDVYAEHARILRAIGYVPQTDIVHPELTVRQELEFAAELRMGPEYDARKRTERVDEVMRQLRLEERADLQIGRLSGGQRKRVSIAIELLTSPNFFLLDEPTSGLDPGNEESLMELLRELADGGRTVVVVTHTVQSLHLCDRVLFMAKGGGLAFYGPPSRALQYFQSQTSAGDLADVFRALDGSVAVNWAGAFLASSDYRQFVVEPLEDREPADPRTGSAAHAPMTWSRQLSILSRRYVAILRGDRGNLWIAALAPPLVGFVFAVALPANSFTEKTSFVATAIAWLLVVCATFLGTFNGFREIVKERAIYERERLSGVLPSAYLASKVVVLGVITTVQCTILAIVMLSRQLLPDPTFFVTDGSIVGSQRAEVIVSVVLAGLVAMLLGLFLSALAKSSDRAVLLLFVAVLLQLALSVGPVIMSSSGGLKLVSNVSSLRWGVSAVASTVDLNTMRDLQRTVQELAAEGLGFLAPGKADPQWNHGASTWLTDVAFLLAIGGAAFGGAGYKLRRSISARRVPARAPSAQPNVLPAPTPPRPEPGPRREASPVPPIPKGTWVSPSGTRGPAVPVAVPAHEPAPPPPVPDGNRAPTPPVPNRRPAPPPPVPERGPAASPPPMPEHGPAPTPTVRNLRPAPPPPVPEGRPAPPPPVRNRRPAPPPPVPERKPAPPPPVVEDGT